MVVSGRGVHKETSYCTYIEIHIVIILGQSIQVKRMNNWATRQSKKEKKKRKSMNNRKERKKMMSKKYLKVMIDMVYIIINLIEWS